jgi:hypothetical protein
MIDDDFIVYYYIIDFLGAIRLHIIDIDMIMTSFYISFYIPYRTKLQSMYI